MKWKQDSTRVKCLSNGRFEEGCVTVLQWFVRLFNGCVDMRTYIRTNVVRELDLCTTGRVQSMNIVIIVIRLCGW